MKRIKMAGACMAALLAISGIATASAFAAGGPLWLVKKSSVESKLTSTATKVALEVTKTPEEFGYETTIKGVKITVKCKTHTLTGAEMIGGTPGTDKGKSELKGCKIEGIVGTLCKIESVTGQAETIGPFNVRSTLVFPESVRSEALDRFLPEAGETFVSLKVVGGSCPNVGEVHVKGCVIAQMWQGGKSSGSGSLAAENELNFPKSVIENSEIWNGTAFVKAAACKLTTEFGSESPQGAVEFGRLALGYTAAEKTAGYETAGWIKE